MSIKRAEKDIQIAKLSVQEAQMLSLVAERQRELVESGETEKLDEFITNFTITKF